MFSRPNFEVSICLTITGRVACSTCTSSTCTSPDSKSKDEQSRNINNFPLTFENNIKLTTIQNMFERFS